MMLTGSKCALIRWQPSIEMFPGKPAVAGRHVWHMDNKKVVRDRSLNYQSTCGLGPMLPQAGLCRASYM